MTSRLVAMALDCRDPEARVLDDGTALPQRTSAVLP
jgi:hypothetical protein